MAVPGHLRLVAAALLLFAGLILPSRAFTIGTGSGHSNNIFAAAVGAAAVDGTKLTATLTGTAGDKYGGDSGGSGTATLTKSGDSIVMEVTVTGLSGAMPPAQAFIRIGTGPYINRVVLGTPQSFSYTTSDQITFRGVFTWQPTEIFPRIPGYTISEIFEFLVQQPGGFYVNVATTSFPTGAVKGSLAAAP